jgi:hypothetical protein
MTETDVLYHNCRLFRTEFGNRYLFVKHRKKYIRLCRRDILRICIECNRGKLPQKHFCICGDFLIIFCHLRGLFSSAGIFSQYCCLRYKALLDLKNPRRKNKSPQKKKIVKISRRCKNASAVTFHDYILCISSICHDDTLLCIFSCV